MPQALHISEERIFRAAGLKDLRCDAVGNNWRLWAGKEVTAIRETEEHILFLGHLATEVDTRMARDELRGGISFPNLLVVARNSAPVTSEALCEILRVHKDHIFRVDQFLSKIAINVLRTGEAIGVERKEYGLEHFVEPHVRLPNQIADTPASVSLLGWLLEKPAEDRNVGVLLAPAGSGKTTLSLELVRRVQAKKGFSTFPLLIDRHQWTSLVQAQDLSLRDIFLAAVKVFYPEAILAADQVDVFLSCGTICPIFDGLDELCTLFQAHFTPTETVEQLHNLFADGRVLVTSRDGFWNDEVLLATRAKTFEIELRPFTEGQRKTYAHQRLAGNQVRIERAYRIFDRLRQKTHSSGVTTSEGVAPNRLYGDLAAQTEERIDLLPYVVMLATESADTNSESPLEKYGKLIDGEDPIEGLILAICDREEERHKLGFDAQAQLEILEIIASEFQEHFTVDDMPLAIGMVTDEVESSRVTNFCRHAFFRTDPQSGMTFRFPFVSEYLLARVVAHWFIGRRIDRPSVLRLIEAGGGVTDRCADLIKALIEDDWIEAARERWRELGSDAQFQASYLHLLLRLSRHSSKGLRSDAVSQLLRVVGDADGRRFSSLHFRGSLNGLDLRGTIFRSCEFRDVEMASCTFDQETYFIGCQFEGQLRFVNNSGIQMIQVQECTFSVQARSSLQREMGRSKRLPITEDQVVTWVKDALGRFRRGNAYFVTRKQDGVQRSLKQLSPHADQILEELVRMGVLETYMSNHHAMYKVQNTHDVRVFLDNASAVGTIRDTLDELCDRLCDNASPREI